MTTLTSAGKTKTRGAVPAGDVVRLPLFALVRHPDNRHPTAARIAAIAQSLDEHDQLEPLVVRALPDGHPHRWASIAGPPIPAGSLAYQIVSGETRALAQLERKQLEVACRIRPACDDATALQLLAEFNAARSDLNPLEKARLIERLCQPTAAGGAGMSRDAAGRIYGLASASAASNLVRLLELPLVLQRFVASGALPQSFARLALPLCGIAPLVKAMGEEIGRWQEDGPPSREEWEQRLSDLVDEHTRDWTPATKQDRSPWALDWTKRRLFSTKEDLGVVELPYAGETVQRATNCVRWDELQDAAKRALRAKSEKTGNDNATAAPKSAAEIAETEAEQDRQLTRRIARWRHAWLRKLIAGRLHQKVPDHFALVRLVLSLLAQQLGFHEHHQLRVAERLQDLLGPKIMREASVKGVLSLQQRSLSWQAVADLLCSMLTLEEKNPDMPVWRTDLIEQLAIDLQIDLPDAWLTMQSLAAGGDEAEKQRFTEFCGLHNTRQLQCLAGQWGVYVEHQPTKSGIVKLLTSGGKIHRIPKALMSPRKRGAE